MEQEGEGRSAADTASESRQHEERAAGPAAQFTHHETASTQGRHTTPAATHHAEGEDIHHHLPLLISTAPGKWQKPAATTQRTRASKPSSIHDAAPKFPAIPPSMGHGAQLNAATHGAPHPQEKRLGLRTPSPPPFSSWPRKKKAAATRNCQHALQKEHSNPLQCASCVCVVVCACGNTKQRSRKEGAEYVERRTKMYSRDAWQKQQQEDRSNS
ncbi:hypothetical protein ECC02_012735 [Trypanosoma cruzi]|uniref:Uncharacterized protein n=1 Tax=Trypanosoma cruzi TaxID=5693 RepID=A0A7J6XKA6_TRYCR|nr:hypothetical protein ECC02_012735 [Trypanosoma cruzi]